MSKKESQPETRKLDLMESRMNNSSCKNCSSHHICLYTDLLPKIFGNKQYRILLCKDCGVGVTAPEPTASIYHYIDSDRPEIISDTVKSSIRSDVLRMKAEYYKIFGKEPQSLLDIGCGNGLFLQVAKELGLKTHGIEPSTLMCKRAVEKGVSVTQCGIAGYENYNKFDLIVLNSVIEHLPNPQKDLKFLANRIGKDTVLCCQQAVYDGFVPRLLKSIWYGWSPEEHYWHFSSLSFERFIMQQQLKVVQKSRVNLYYQWVPLLKIRHWKSFLLSNFQKFLSVLAIMLRQGDSVTFYVMSNDAEMPSRKKI
jgi:SAM-dependent methyltransferase